MKKVLIIVIFFILLVAFFSTLPFFRSATNDQSLTDLQQKGVIRIGYAVEAPYAYVLENGKISGESPEVAKVIVGRLGIKRVEWHQSEFSALIDNLVTGKIDLIAAGMFITPERAGRVNFSEPTFHVQQSMLVLNGNPLDIHSYQQAVLNKARVAVISEAVEGIWLQNLGLQPNNLISVPNALTGKLSVETGISDALALSSPTIHWISMHDDTGKTEVAIPFDQVAINGQKYQGYGAFAFRQQDQQLLKAWNEQLKTYVGSPDHLKLISEFGFTADELPGKTTTEEIIRGK